MIYWRFQSTDPAFSRQVAVKSLMAGLFFIALGGLILVVPQLVVIPLAALVFVIGFICLMTAWRIFWASKSSASRGTGKDYEDASFREIP